MERFLKVKDGQTADQGKQQTTGNQAQHLHPPLYLVREREARGGVEQKPLTAGLLVLPWQLSLHWIDSRKDSWTSRTLLPFLSASEPFFCCYYFLQLPALFCLPWSFLQFYWSPAQPLEPGSKTPFRGKFPRVQVPFFQPCQRQFIVHGTRKKMLFCWQSRLTWGSAAGTFH